MIFVVPLQPKPFYDCMILFRVMVSQFLISIVLLTCASEGKKTKQNKTEK